MIVLAWPAQHFQQLRIILRGRQHLEHLIIFCVASAAFSAAKDHFAWQAQHLKHLMIKKWRAARKTCNRNVLRALREENVMIACARLARVTILDRNVISHCGAMRIL